MAYVTGYTAIGFETIGSARPSFDSARFRAEVEYQLSKELQREGEIVRRMYVSTTRTWFHKPNFTIEVNQSGENFTVTVYTDSKIYLAVDGGTDIRYDVMSIDFEPKTHPRVIGSRKGKGGRAYVGKDPRLGIEAREFTEEIADRRYQYFYNNMDKIFNHLVDKYWYGREKYGVSKGIQ